MQEWMNGKQSRHILQDQGKNAPKETVVNGKAIA
jgi:hypothetical protein